MITKTSASEWLFFGQHWPSFLESYWQKAKEWGEYVRLPDIRAASLDGQEGLAIALGADPAILQRATLLYGARPFPGVDLSSLSLTPTQLLQLLPWVPATLDGASAQRRLPERLLIRLAAATPEAFADAVGELLQVLFEISAPGIRRMFVSAALLEQSDRPHEGLFFVTLMHQESLQEWLNRRAKPLGITLYRPYEPYVENPNAADGQAEQREHPRGVWLPLQLDGSPGLSLPYLSILAQTIRHQQESEVWLAETAPNGGTTVSAVLGSFERIYYFSGFHLIAQSQAVTPLLVDKRPLRPFEVRLDLRADPDRRPDLEARRHGLDEDERMIKDQLKELHRQQRRVLYLRRLLEKDEIVAAPSGADPAARPRKRLFLFFEQHPGSGGRSPAWPALQELLFTASLAELRAIRYTFCSFTLREGAPISFHLVGGPPLEAQSDPLLPPGLERADIIFEQDLGWREVGYNLYTPARTYLGPYMLPNPLVLHPRPKPASAGPLTGPPQPGDEEIWPGPTDSYQLYNDLLAQAIYCPDPEGGLAEARELLPALRNSDHLCLIYEDPDQRTRVPIIIRDTHWQRLADVGPARLNQRGLELVHTTVGVVQQIGDQIAQAVSQDVGWVEIEGVAEDLAARMRAVLAKALSSREHELAEERIAREAEFRIATERLERELAGLEQEWEGVERDLRNADQVLRGSLAERLLPRGGGKLGAAQRLVERLKERAKEVETVANTGVDSWASLVDALADVTQRIEADGAQELAGALAKLQDTDARLQSLDRDLVAKIKPRVLELNSLLATIGTSAGGRLETFEVVLSGLTRAIAALDSSSGSIGSDTVQMRASDQEARLLRERIDNIEATLQEERSAVADQIAALGARAREADMLRDQLARTEEIAREQERSLRDDLAAYERQVSDDKQRILNYQQELERTSTELGKSQGQIMAASRRLEDVNRELSDLRQQLEQAQADTERVEIDAYNLERTQAKSRFERIAEAIDRLHAIQGVSPAVAKGIVHIHQGFVAALERTYLGLSWVAVHPYETLFDVHAGYGIIDEVNQENAGDGIITQVIKDAYTYNGKPLREGAVVVNKRSHEVRADESVTDPQ